MKKRRILGLLFAFTVVGFTLSNCGDDETLESCSQEEICTAKSVVACCDQSSCVYKYDGKEYPEDELDQLADDLGCSGGSGARIAAGEERAQLIERLQALLMTAKAGLE